MTYAGVPWRVDVHERLLTDLLGPAAAARRPAATTRGAGWRGARRVRRQPVSTSTPELLAALRRAGLDVTDTRASSLRAPSTRASPRCVTSSFAHLFQTNGWLDRRTRAAAGSGRRTSRPAPPPAGGPPTAGRAVVPGAGPTRGRGRRRLGVRGRRRRPARATRARGHERRPRWPGRHAAPTSTRDGRRRRGGQPQRRLLGLLGAMYGATSGESGRMVAGLTRRYPDAFGLVEQAARAGERGEVVRTPTRVADPGRRVGSRPRRPARRSRQPGPAPPRVRPLHPQLHRHGRRGRCAGSPTCATGSGVSETASRLGHTWSSSSTTRSSCTPRPRWPMSRRRPPRRHATAAGLLFRDLTIDFPLNVSIVRSYADAGKPGAAVES